MTDEVRHELEMLVAYAEGVGLEAKRFPELSDIIDGGRGYLGGALTTPHHLRLISDGEHREWSERLMAPLPGTPGSAAGEPEVPSVAALRQLRSWRRRVRRR